MSSLQYDTTMPAWLDRRAYLTPERTAAISGKERRTFAELAKEARSIGGKLAGLGIEKGDRVAFLMQNGVHTVTLIHGVTGLGAVLVPLNTRLAPREIAWQMKDCGAKVLVYDSVHREQAEAARSVVPDSGVKVISWQQLLQQREVEVKLPDRVSLQDLHTIMYTSGTTGQPKGVMLTWGNHWWSATASALNLGLDPHERWLAAVPLFHMSGLSILMRSVIYGMTAVIHPTFDPAEANRAIREEGVMVVSVVGTMLTRMLDELGEEVYPHSFRGMLLGGGPAPKPLLERCAKKGVPVFQTYGMTETASQIVTLAPEYSLAKLGSAGKPLFPSELKIVKDGQEAAAWQAGEIVVKGPNVTHGYWQREEATREAIRDGWLYTGDIGYLDDDGFLYVLDRRKDLIISGGENVYPAEVEAVLLAHPSVADAGVTGIPDSTWGQVPVGFVSIKEGADFHEGELLSYCREQLARYKVPVRIHAVEELPKNASNKLMRRELARWASQEGGSPR